MIWSLIVAVTILSAGAERARGVEDAQCPLYNADSKHFPDGC